MAVLKPGVGEHYGWSSEATLANVEYARSAVLVALVKEELDLRLAQPSGKH